MIGWAGMRGSVSLAAALAVPLETDAGGPFPERDLIIFLAFAVILVTLVGQGLTLGPLIDRLGIDDDGADEREEVDAPALRLAEAALAASTSSRCEDWVRDDTVERVRGMYALPRAPLRRARRRGRQSTSRSAPTHYMRLMFELFDAQREELISLRNSLEISDEVRRRIERDLDLEESRLRLLTAAVTPQPAEPCRPDQAGAASRAR